MIVFQFLETRTQRFWAVIVRSAEFLGTRMGFGSISKVNSGLIIIHMNKKGKNRKNTK